MTIHELFELIFKEHWNQPRFLRSGWALEAQRIYGRLIAPTFSAKDQAQIKAIDIRKWHQSLNQTPLQANRALGVLSKMLSFAEEQELRPQGQNVCKLVKPFMEKSRKRFGTVDELRKILSILDRECATNPKEVAFIYALIFSGARGVSLVRSTWSEMSDIGDGFWLMTFSGKSTEATGEDEQVIFPPQVTKLLGPKGTGKIFGASPRIFWEKVRKEAGCNDLQLRDLRRTFATVGLSNGLSKGIIGELLNHKNPATTDIYAKLMNHKRVEATKIICEQIDKLRKTS